MPVGKKVIIIGSGLHGIELAEFLVRRKRNVTIIDTSPKPGEGMLDLHRYRVIGWLINKGVAFHNEIKSLEITKKGVVFQTGEKVSQNIMADTIIVTQSLESNTMINKLFEGKAPEIYLVGDCREPGMIVDAIADGWRIAKNL